ncbi:MAG TPA: peptidoglycan-binding domain-containing protein [Aestuariivirgaceae bacterium]|nr:peptidoglycan-binding domain-containing protein [Aestuariivirgaceae bacterium]
MSRPLAFIAAMIVAAAPAAGSAGSVTGQAESILVAQASPADIERTKEIQRGLQRRGYDPGPIDGFLGRRTAQAIRKFQADHGLAVNGMPSRTVYEMLAGEANGG